MQYASRIAESSLFFVKNARKGRCNVTLFVLTTNQSVWGTLPFMPNSCKIRSFQDCSSGWFCILFLFCLFICLFFVVIVVVLFSFLQLCFLSSLVFGLKFALFQTSQKPTTRYFNVTKWSLVQSETLKGDNVRPDTTRIWRTMFWNLLLYIVEPSGGRHWHEIADWPLLINWDILSSFHPRSDKFQISPGASPEI